MKKETLGNRIRKMTDEELAEFISNISREEVAEFISNISREEVENKYCKVMCSHRVQGEDGVMGCRVVLEKCPYSYKDIWLDFLHSVDDRMDYNGCMPAIGTGSSSSLHEELKRLAKAGN